MDYVKKMSTYLKQQYGLNIYISSSDKNVAGEAFLTDTPTWIVGLGTRQHTSFYKSVGYGQERQVAGVLPNASMVANPSYFCNYICKIFTH